MARFIITTAHTRDIQIALTDEVAMDVMSDKWADMPNGTEVVLGIIEADSDIDALKHDFCIKEGYSPEHLCVRELKH